MKTLFKALILSGVLVSVSSAHDNVTCYSGGSSFGFGVVTDDVSLMYRTGTNCYSSHSHTTRITTHGHGHHHGGSRSYWSRHRENDAYYDGIIEGRKQIHSSHHHRNRH